MMEQNGIEIVERDGGWGSGIKSALNDGRYCTNCRIQENLGYAENLLIF